MIGCKDLEKLLCELDEANKIKLESGHSAYIQRLRIQLKPGAALIHAKQRCFPSGKREIMIKYVPELLSPGLVKKVSSPEWFWRRRMCQSAPVHVLTYRLLPSGEYHYSTNVFASARRPS